LKQDTVLTTAMLVEHIDNIVPLAIAGLVIAGLWYAMRPQRVFTLWIENGAVRGTRGSVPRSFVQDAASICQSSGVAGGTIYGLRRGRSIMLAFSGPIDDQCRQRLRNVWQIQHSLR
jgi:hypothetical protein